MQARFGGRFYSCKWTLGTLETLTTYIMYCNKTALLAYRLRRENESVVVVVAGKDSDKPTCSTQGRDSSASSGSSSETLKWHGSNSDLSTVSSGGHRVTTQLIAHSAKVSAPQRHHSESVLSVTDSWSGSSVGGAVQEPCRVGGNHRNLRKLFPVSTYTVQPALIVDEKTSPKYALVRLIQRG